MFMGIDWKKRFKNKYFWFFILAVFLTLFTNLDIASLSDKIKGTFDIILALIAILGISVDTSSPTICDKKKIETIANEVETILEETVEEINNVLDNKENNDTS